MPKTAQRPKPPAPRRPAARIAPGGADATARGLELQGQGRDEEAGAAFRTALARQPNEPVALYSLAALLMKAQRSAEALPLVERGVAAAPHFAPMWFAHGTVMQALGRREEALQSYDRALGLKPALTEALINSGALLRELHRHREALERFNRVLEIDPKHEAALGNSGILLTEFKQSEQAIAMFERLLTLNPAYPWGLGLLSYERLHICDWTDFEPLRERIIAGVRDGRPVTKTLGLMAISDQAEDHHRAARCFAATWFGGRHEALWRGERYGHQRLRVAYVSPDLREHPVGHLMAGVFERHDKARFETYAISVGVDDGSRLRERMKQSFDHFIDLRGLGARQIAEQMRAHEIDIAIDLSGYTSDSRVEVFAHRPAPLQVTWLGYPGTLGSEHFDVILADRHVIPPEQQRFYTEQVAYLPDTYLPTDASVQIAERTPTRAECGLPETGPVLCSFSHDYKINPPLFASWMRILQRVEGSVLWLVSRNALSQAHLRREAQARGIAPERLVFAERVPRVEDHLARYRLADLFLDTTPYNAHTTAADALMAGLPVVTCLGNAFPARVAASLLHAAGLPELVTQTMAEYEALAVSLVTDRPRLAALKAKLAANRERSPLFDTNRFCKNLEDTLMTLHHARDTQAAPPATATPVRRLHIGGKLREAGWEVLNALPGPDVDHLGNANDLSRFADNSFETVYASHVVEHFDYRDELHRTLSEWCRVLKPGGLIQVSVPDLEVLAGLMLNKQLQLLDRFMVMRMIFGGHMDAYDYHQVGLTEEILGSFLLNAGFVGVQRVERFGHFRDTSDMQFAGQRISLNMQASKPLR